MFKKWTNPKNLKIIDILRKNMFNGFLLKEIENRLGLSHHPTYRRVKQLESGGIIKKKDSAYRLNLKNPETIEILYFLSREESMKFQKKFKNDLFVQLERQFNEDDSIKMAVVFGSYARRQETPSSDLDIFIVSSKNSINKNFESMYNVKSSVIFVRKTEFEKMIKDRKKIVKDIFREGIVLKGNIYETLAKHYLEW